MLALDLRYAITRAVADAGFARDVDPGLRPTGTPGQYAASVALTLGGTPRETAQTIAIALAAEPWIASAEVTGPGYLTITVTPEALAAVADTITAEGPACVNSRALAGATVPSAPAGDPLAAPTWEKARAALAAQLTVRLAAAAGAALPQSSAPERSRPTRPVPATQAPSSATGAPVTEGPTHMSGAARHDICGNFMTGTQAPPEVPAAAPGAGRSRGGDASPAEAVTFAGRDAVLFTLARTIPGRPLRVDPEIMARHVLSNPAYAVRYAHARAASGVRWAVVIRGDDPPCPPLSRSADPMAKGAIVSGPPSGTASCGDTGASWPETTALPRFTDDPGELGLLDALSWLPERVATAARRGRPDEFARYLEDLARHTVDVLSSASRHVPASAGAPGSGKLTLAVAARTGLAAGLGLLGISAPERLLDQDPDKTMIQPSVRP